MTDRARCRALHYLGRLLLWWALRPRQRGTESGARALAAVGHLCEVRQP